jgi:hypothetical protein
MYSGVTGEGPFPTENISGLASGPDETRRLSTKRDISDDNFSPSARSDKFALGSILYPDPEVGFVSRLFASSPFLAGGGTRWGGARGATGVGLFVHSDLAGLILLAS